MEIKDLINKIEKQELKILELEKKLSKIENRINISFSCDEFFDEIRKNKLNDDNIDYYYLYVNSKEPIDGNTALIIASKQGQLDLVKVLVDNGANINIQDNIGKTALMWASFNGHLEIVQYLIEKDVDMDIQNEYLRTALMKASFCGYLNIVQYLINGGAKLDIQDQYGETALMMASSMGHLEVVQYLIENGADMDIQNIYGDTALYYQRENIEGIKLFLQSKQYSNKIKQLKRKNISFNKFIEIL